MLFFGASLELLFKKKGGQFQGAPTVDGRNPAPPKKPWNGDSPVNANEQWIPMASNWCRMLSIHSMYNEFVVI